MVAWVALAGLAVVVAGIVALDGGSSSSLRPLVRLAIVAPLLVYVLWWIASPGIIRGGADVESTLSVREPELLMNLFDRTADEDFTKARPRVTADVVASGQPALHRPSAGPAIRPNTVIPEYLRPRFRREPPPAEPVAERDVSA